MFTRFTTSARAVVVVARERALDDGAAEIRVEHLLAALLEAPSAGPLLGQVGLADGSHAAVLAEIRDARRRGGLSPVDAEALAGLGINLDEVVGRVEAELGAGALDDTRPAPGRWSRLRMSTATALALQTGLHQATARGDRELREEHLLLGLLGHPNLVADALGVRGVTTATVLAALNARPPQGRAS